MNQWRTCAGVLSALLLTGCTAGAAAASATAYPAASSAAYPAASTAAYTAAGAAGGHVTGKLVRAGGPMGPGGKQPGEQPLPGTVTFTAAGHRPVSVRVGASGKFSVWLDPGRYRVAGRSPDIETVTSTGKDLEQTCSQPLSVTVRARHATAITVVCPVP
jgi:hypothetical protein